MPTYRKDKGAIPRMGILLFFVVDDFFNKIGEGINL